jgi:hypothetical protein
MHHTSSNYVQIIAYPNILEFPTYVVEEEIMFLLQQQRRKPLLSFLFYPGEEPGLPGL